MIAYQPFQSVRLGQVAYAQSYPPSGLEWGQGWGRFSSSSPKVVLPKSPEAGGGVGYTSEGTVLSREDYEALAVATGQGPGAVQPSPGASASSGASEGGKFPLVAAGVAALAILGSMVA